MALTAVAEAYWLWAFGIAGAFYATTRWFGGHMSPDAKESLALWLMGTEEDNWPRQFRALFDRTFGERPLSARFVLRSCIASLLAVLALYLLFDVALGVMETRAESRLALAQALLIGAAINLVPDYLSLVETRWLLGQMRRVRSVPGQVALLALDLAVTAALIWASISLYRWIAGEGPVGAVEMLAFFSPYALFFYSTFLTSVWAWVYCLSAWVLKLFTRAGLARLLDVENKPVSQLALVGAAMLLLASLPLAPLAAPAGENGPVSRLDTWLCTRFPDESCHHIERRLTDDEAAFIAFLDEVCGAGAFAYCLSQAQARFGKNDVTVFRLASRTCEAGYAQGCSGLGDLYFMGVGSAQDSAKAAELYRQGCEGGDARGCSSLGVMHLQGAGVARDNGRAMALFLQGCEGGHAGGCTGLGTMYQNGLGVPQDLAQAVSLYRQGCEGGDALGCSGLGSMYAQGAGVPRSPAQAVALYQRSCEGGYPRGCSNLGFMYRNGLGVPRDDAQAAALYRQGCDGGHAGGCSDLGSMYRNGLGVPRDDAQAADLFRQGCEGEDALGCTNLGFMYGSGLGVARDHGKAMALFRQGCEGGHAGGCSNLGSFYEDGLAEIDPVADAELLRKACDLGGDWACALIE